MNTTVRMYGEIAGRAREERPLSGKVALITGGSRGIGAAIARDLAHAGASVNVNFLSRENDASALCNELCETGATAVSRRANVARTSDVGDMIERVVNDFGKIDILINNAGILRDRSFKNMAADEWDDVIQTNLSGVFNVTRAVVPGMIERGGGTIVNISSVIGQTGNFGQANYAAAKAGIIGLTRTLALELARYGIRVNTICPGFVDTSMWSSIPENVREQIIAKIPLQRVAKTADIVHGVRYLIDAGYVTGESLNINGGMFMA